MVVRPLVRRVLAPDERALAPPAAATDGAASETSPSAASKVEPVTAEPSKTAKMIDIKQVQGQVHAQSVQKVGELADRNPREAVSIIRQWLNESPA
jgi:flagellar M-ring protein FliF